MEQKQNRIADIIPTTITATNLPTEWPNTIPKRNPERADCHRCGERHILKDGLCRKCRQHPRRGLTTTRTRGPPPKRRKRNDTQ